MGNDWFTADTHFSHRNIIAYSGRPFSFEEHDDALVSNWNASVKPGDRVYFLGDLAFGGRERTLATRRRLNGTIFFIEGNHDSSARQIRDTFAWYDKTKLVTINGRDVYMSHYAHRVWPRSHYGVYHAYGHSHNSLPDDPFSLGMDVGVDATAARLSGIPTGQTPLIGTTKPEDYRPISFDEMEAFMALKKWKPVDHHVGNHSDNQV
jgi:calcineurin-like phosphoesterase family protein